MYANETVDRSSAFFYRSSESSGRPQMFWQDSRMDSKATSSRLAAQGFTLLELMVTMAIAAVLLAIAVPNVRNQILASEARQTARSVKDAIDYARQYALNTSTITTFTPNGCGYTVMANGPTNTTLTSSSGAGGWVVNCTGNLGTVSFMGDGSAASCSTNASGTTCAPLSSNQTFSVSGGGTTWTVTLLSSGLTTP
jgi:prepilin-type N-terminal cleavage/methylation domain-containing protein